MTKSGFDLDDIERLLAAATPDPAPRSLRELDERGYARWAFGNAMIEAAPAMLTEIRELRAENARLNTDLRRCFGGETHAVRNERVMQKIHDYTENALAAAALKARGV